MNIINIFKNIKVLLTTTRQEREMIKAIAFDDHTRANGSMPESLDDIGWIRISDVAQGEDLRTIVDLINKGLVTSTSWAYIEHADVALTEEGFKAFQALTR